MFCIILSMLFSIALTISLGIEKNIIATFIICTIATIIAICAAKAQDN